MVLVEWMVEVVDVGDYVVFVMVDFEFYLQIYVFVDYLWLEGVWNQYFFIFMVFFEVMINYDEDLYELFVDYVKLFQVMCIGMVFEVVVVLFVYFDGVREWMLYEVGVC